jgi:hypothetical protein
MLMANEKQLNIEVRDKIATFKSKNFNLVGGNSDYDVVFDFDEDWENYSAKTAVFVFGKGKPVYQVFEGNVCEGVEIYNSTMCLIGVFAGDIKTTTPAMVDCVYRSILDEANGTPEPPSEDVYNQIMDLLNRYINAVKGAPSGGKSGQVLKKNSDQDYDYSWQDDVGGSNVSEDYIISVVNDYLAKNPPQNGVSPTVEITPIENGHRVTITDINGDHSFDVLNGDKGDKGDPYTLTESDKIEITNKVLANFVDVSEVGQ